jgi:Flp pilus assembly protein TadD
MKNLPSMIASNDQKITAQAFSDAFNMFDSGQGFLTIRGLLSDMTGGEDNAREILKIVRQILEGKTLAQGLGIEPEELEAMHVLARLQKSEGRYLEAMQIYGLLIIFDQNDPRFHKGLGLSVKALGEAEKALELLLFAYALDADDKEIALAIAECHLAADRREIAEKMLENLVSKPADGEEEIALNAKAKAILELLEKRTSQQA